MVKGWMLVMALLLPPVVASGEGYPHVVALFNGQAMVQLGGERHLLREGDSLPNGMRLVSADSNRALFERNGERVELGLTDRVGGRYQSAPGATTEVRIPPDGGGMYRADGRINDIPVRFIVDTGASTVALSSGMARRLGVDYSQGMRVRVATASGDVIGHRITLRRVSLGGLERGDVAAVVLEGAYPREPLLGMSFLGQVRMRSAGQVLVLDAQ